MTARFRQRSTSLFAAAGYLLALVASMLSHEHLHPAAEGPHAHACHSAHDHDFACDHDDHDATEHQASVAHANETSAHEDCSICQFLGRPMVLAEPFELVARCDRVYTLALTSAPSVRVPLRLATQARAPPASTLASVS